MAAHAFRHERRSRVLHEREAAAIRAAQLGGNPELVLDGKVPNRDFLHLYGPRGLDITVAGLCDAGEELGDFLPALLLGRGPRLHEAGETGFR